MDFLNSTFFRNILGLIAIFLIWLIFSIIGLRGVTLGKSITDIRQEAGLSLLSLLVFTLAIIGLVAFFATSKASAFTPFPS